MASNVVVVESPAKAETINKYLGSDYAVIASYGHVRDLPPKNGSVDPEHDFSMVWEMEPRSKKRVDDIAKLVKKADRLLLATDPDREGEAISWHVHEVLKESNLLKDKDVKRVVFYEITKKAILKAIDSPRQINQSLVDAYMARRALDYLVGFTLSPVLWRKLPGSRSAGRVQSVALRLICERESEIEDFKPQEYWSLETTFSTSKNESFKAYLSQADGNKLDRLSIDTEVEANRLLKLIEGSNYNVGSIARKTVNRNPQPPFITSTLQQDAARKLGFGVGRTMSVAQSLYEGIKLDGPDKVGLITYMRTDGVNLSEDAVASIRTTIGSNYGQNYLPDGPRVYKSKSKNAQEAHEAIRPTDINRTPKQVRDYLNDDQYKLYELIWNRTMACQMASAVLDQVSVDIEATPNKLTFRATGSILKFDGFLKVYRDAKEEDGDAKDEDKRLPELQEGQDLKRLSTDPEQHFTKPPPRFTEASLVKQMEELGIGRPSTYASIIRILQDRNYVVMENRRFIPEDRGRLVTTFLTNFFERYVQYDFTAQLEEKLDDISGDRLRSKDVLTEFWKDFHKAVNGTKDLTITQVLDVLDEDLGSHFFPPSENGEDPRQCTNCKDGRLSLKLGRYGAFIGCSNYPECKFTRRLKSDGEGGGDDELVANGPVELGMHPEHKKMVYLNKGPYGFYVQLGEEEEIPPEQLPPTKKGAKPKKPKKIKPKRTSLPRGLAPTDVNLETALSLLSLPRELGVYPETGDTITADLGRFGPYVKFGATYVSLKKEDDVLTIGLDRAIELIKASGKKSYPLGEYKKKPVVVQKGRFGFYIQYNKGNYTLPKGTEPESVTLEQATEIIEAKLAKEGEKGGKVGTKAKSSSKSTSKSKSSGTKSTAKKTTKKKTTAKSGAKSKS